MRRIFFALLIGTLATSIVGCGAGRKRYEAGLQSLTGQHYDSLVRRWGPPTNAAPLSDGSIVVSWSKSESGQNATYTTSEYRTAMVGNQLVSYYTPVSHGGGSYYHDCTIRAEFDTLKIAKSISYQGGAACKEWFPVPEVEPQ